MKLSKASVCAGIWSMILVSVTSASQAAGAKFFNVDTARFTNFSRVPDSAGHWQRSLEFGGRGRLHLFVDAFNQFHGRGK